MKTFCILCIVFLIIACEYKVDGDFYREVTPPEPEIQFEVKLNNIYPADTIYLLSAARITLYLNTNERELYDLKITLDGRTLEHFQAHDGIRPYVFFIDPSEISDGNHKLSVNIITASGSGSLADLMKMEGYQGEMVWNVYTVNNFEEKFTLGFRKMEGMLEFYWELPEIPHVLFDKYEIRAESTHLSITDQSKKSVIVEDYVCGDIQCSVSIVLKNHEGDTRSFFKYLNFSSPTPQLYFKDISLNKLLVYWDKPFSKARFSLRLGWFSDEVIFTTDTFQIVPQVPFSAGVTYYLSIYPEKSEDIYTHIYTYKEHSITSNFSHASNVAYHTDIGKILAISNDEIWTINPTTYNETTLAKLPYSNSRFLSCVTGTSKIVIRHEEEFWIYPDHTFSSPSIIVPNRWGWAPEFFQITNNDRIFTVDMGYGTDDVCNVYDAIDGSVIFSFNISRFYSIWSVSINGKYFCEATANGMTIYKIGIKGVEQTVHVPGFYTGVFFNPLNPDQLIAKERDNIHLFESPDFTTPVLSFIVPASARLLNIDPATGNLLYLQRYSSQDTLRVARLELIDRPLFSMATASTDVILLDNCLINTHGAKIFNITPYLNP